MAYQLLGSDKILRLNDSDLLGLVQSEDWSPNFNAQDIFELGNLNRVATSTVLETSGSLELNAIGGTPGLLARMIPKRLGTGVFSGYEYVPSGHMGRNAYTFTEISLREAQFDLVIHEKSDNVNFDRSVVLPRCFLGTFSGRADAQGFASETVNFTGDFVIGAPSPYHDIRCVPCVPMANGTIALVTSDATLTSANYTLLYVYLDEKRWRTTSTDSEYVTFTGPGISCTNFNPYTLYPLSVGRAIMYKTTPSTTFPSIFTGYSGDVASATASTLVVSGTPWSVNAYTGYSVAITAGLGVGQVRVIKSNTNNTLTLADGTTWATTPDATSDFTIFSRDSQSFFVPGYQVDVYLAPASVSSPASSEQWLKVQSADWNVDMRMEALRQLAFNAAGTSVYARVPTYPINITLNASVFETDWKDWKAVLSKTFPGNDKYQDTYDFAPASIKPTFAAVIIYKTRLGNKLMEWRFTDLRLDGRGERTQVGGRAEMSWSFAGTAFTIVGYNNY